MSTRQPFDQFTPARWRGTTFPTNCVRDGARQVAAVSFDTPAGVLHLLFDEETADAVAHACTYFRTAHSERSSDMPKVEMSPSDGQLQDPPATSSTAT
jgi:hypothetical protein